MESTIDQGRIERTRFLSGKLGSTRRALNGNVVLVDGDPFVHFLDPNGSNRTIALPALTTGDDWRVVTNVGSANSLVVTNANGLLITTLAHGQSALCFGSSAEWIALRGWADLGDFGPAGVGHSSGLVPDPGAVAGLARFLEDSGNWVSIATPGIVDAYKIISDGTHTATASGLSQLRLRSSDSSITLVVTDNDGVFGDVVNFVVAPGAVNHNLLLNYVANQHIDHSAVSISTAEGIQGGGDLTSTRTLKLNYSGLGTASPALSDTVSYFQTATHYKTTWSTINGILDHNALLNYAADRHIAHSGVSIIAGTGLSGGGDISASRTLNIAYSGLSVVTTMATADLLGLSHLGTMESITFGNFNTALDHNVLTNYVANQHIDHTSVSIIAGAGLSGGGTIAANRTITLLAPTASVLGGVISSTAGANQWASGINTSGAITYSQPAFSNISGNLTLAQFPSIATSTVLGNVSGGSAVPTALSTAQLTTLINAATTSLSGASPALPVSAPTTKFHRGDNTYAVPDSFAGFTNTGTIVNSGTHGGVSGMFDLDVSSGGVALVNGGTVDFYNFSGIVAVNCPATGNTIAFICGGGSVTTIATAGAACGTFLYEPTVTGYRFTASGGAATYAFLAFRLRATA